jgi:hypothetical protein
MDGSDSRLYRHIEVRALLSENPARRAHPIDEDLSMGTPEAEAEGFGDSKVEADNEVWPDFHPSDEDLSLGTPDFRRNPKGWGQFSRSLRHSSLGDTRYPSLLAP